jgi:hypothetical protein
MADVAETRRRLVYLRSRAAYYRQQAEQATDPEQAAYCREMAETFARDAAAMEAARPE